MGRGVVWDTQQLRQPFSILVSMQFTDKTMPYKYGSMAECELNIENVCVRADDLHTFSM